MEDALRDGAWRGRRCFILGGGPSILDLNLSLLREETTLGLNMAFLHNPTANLIYDKRLMDALALDPAWSSYSGSKLWLNYEDRTIAKGAGPGGVQQLHECRRDPAYPSWPTSLKQGLYRGNNAGTAGISLADILGADLIYLLGYDLRAEAGRPPNWHDRYPEAWRAKQCELDQFRLDISRTKGMVRGRVINLTPGSAMDAFPCARLEDILGCGTTKL